MEKSYEQRHALLLSNPGFVSTLFRGQSAAGQNMLVENLKEVLRLDRMQELACSAPALKDLVHSDVSDEKFEAAYHEEKAKRMDDTGVIFSRQLEEIDARTFEVKHKKLGKWRKNIPIHQFAPGTEFITYRQYDFSGEAQVNAPGNKEFDFAEVDGNEFTQKVNLFQQGYRYTFAELRKASLAGQPIDAFKIRAVQKAFETKLQKVMYLGDSDLNLPGFLTDVNIPEGVAPNAVGGGNSPVWGVDKTPDEVISDITGLPSATVSNYDGAFGDLGDERFRIALSAAKMLYIMRTPRSINSDTSIYNWIKENFNELIEGFDLIHEAKAAGQGGTQLMMSYVRDPDVAEAHVADSIIWQAPQFHNFEVRFPAEMEFGGVENRYPLTFNKMYGI